MNGNNGEFLRGTRHYEIVSHEFLQRENYKLQHT